MRSIEIIASLTSALVAGCSLLEPAELQSQIAVRSQRNEVINQVGSYESFGGKCPIVLITSKIGGFIQLIPSVQGDEKHIVDDITGVGYLSDSLLVYTVSPVYGDPGVYLYDCISKSTNRIVNPRTLNKAYPNGSDYFELYGWRENRILFYYAPDVDSIDFSSFRTHAFLYEVQLDGSQFKQSR